MQFHTGIRWAQTPPPVSTIVIESPVAPEGEDEIQEGTEEAGEGETGGATGTGAEGGTTAPASRNNHYHSIRKFSAGKS